MAAVAEETGPSGITAERLEINLLSRAKGIQSILPISAIADQSRYLTLIVALC
tara:strand:- start:2589 stop:2747 length:159 start_codon:yes stop_codon:yes gene_type:complete